MDRSSWFWIGITLFHAATAQASERITVKQFKVIGSTVFQDWEFANVTQPYEDQPLVLEDLQKAAEAVTRYYLDHGYLTSRAVLGNQTIENGIVYIQVVEGRLASINIQGKPRIPKSYIRDRIQRAQLNPLNQEDLENHLRLLRNDPLIGHLDASIKEGEQSHQSNLTVNVKDADPRIAVVSVDNHSSESVGRMKLNAIVGTRNLSGSGDLLLANYARTNTGGASLWNLMYQRILNPKQGTLSLRIAPNQYRITQPGLSDLNITGSSQFYEVSFRQPLTYKLDREFAVSLALAHRTGETFISEMLTNSDQSTTLQFGQDFLRRDRAGTWLAQSQFNLGTASTQFLTWTGQLQRLQTLSRDHTVIAQVGWQLSPSVLPVSQQINLGGAQSLRGYARNGFNGDNGVTATIENQFTLTHNSIGEPTLKLSPFLDAGTLWNHPNSPIQINQSLLFSTGVSLAWKPTTTWTIRLDAAFPLTNVDRAAAFYFNSVYQF